MSFIYFDCFSGVSGDMIIAALLDCGASFEALTQAVENLDVAAHISSQNLEVKGIRCKSFAVAAGGAPLRHLADIEQIIGRSNLAPVLKAKTLQVFHKLAAAEASVHGVSPAEVHFHEIGAVDTLVDIVGTLVCLDSLAITEVYSSSLPWSGGLISISHGRYPLPAPATALLLTDFPCFFAEAGVELVTPTGAALITTLAAPLLDPPAFTPTGIGYGAGKNQRKDGVPNLLRAVKADFVAPLLVSEAVAVLETEVDDLNPEIYSYLHGLFISHPAVWDYYTSPVYMKKNRPGTLITLVARPEAAEMLAQLLMQESGSLGVRYRLQNRYIIPRSESSLPTPWGPVRIKQSHLAAGSIRTKPEFEDCQTIAREHHISLLEVYAVINALIASLPE
ncbi:MAG: nickel pincer cofactor biosynthesis protein LarC [Firmicutes bacterium]|nr:nickel pincer cofactor biosynthesis protein LarC [Bacillota bacterium]